jgi:hypothetical protein
MLAFGLFGQTDQNHWATTQNVDLVNVIVRLV